MKKYQYDGAVLREPAFKTRAAASGDAASICVCHSRNRRGGDARLRTAFEETMARSPEK